MQLALWVMMAAACVAYPAERTAAFYTTSFVHLHAPLRGGKIFKQKISTATSLNNTNSRNLLRVLYKELVLRNSRLFQDHLRS